MKLATDFGLEAPSRQVGVFDTDGGKCIITHPDSDPPTGGCTPYHTESIVNRVADTCPGNKQGDGKCEQACGADAACDEKSPGEYCGTNARCTDYCSCCVASDSDNGKDYLKKGTATGLMFEGGYRNCSTKTDYCLNDGKTVVEYYTGSGYLFYEDHDCSNDENKKCVDGHCGCVYDSDCAANGKCCSPSGSVPLGSSDCREYDYLCKWPKCGSNPECGDKFCCDADASIPQTDRGDGNCWSQGTIYKNKYLCAPKQ